jgi:fatty-acyl-CoA synthase
MAGLDSVVSGARKSIADAAFELRVLTRAGLITPMGPVKAAKAGATFVRWGASPATGIAIAAIHHPHETAVVDELGSLTFERVHRRSNALARALAAKGIGCGDGVGVMCRNHRGFIDATLAAAKLGASALYLNTMFAGPQLAEVTRREKPKVLIHDEEFTGLLEGVDEEVERIVAWTDGEPDAPTLEQLIAAGDEADLKPPPDTARFIILTSGTTGTPKGAQRSSPDGLFAIAALIDKIPYRSREKMMIAAPLFHSWGFLHFVISLPTTSTIVLRRRFDPEETLRAVDESRANVLAAVPVMVQRILGLPGEVLDRYSLSSLRITSLSGSALPASWRSPGWTASATTSTTSTARRRSRTRRWRRRRTFAPPPAPPDGRRGGRSCGSSTRTAARCLRARWAAFSSATRCRSRATPEAAAKR